MIRDTVTYGGQTILTIYHRDLDDDIKSRRLKITEKVGFYNLVFTETIVSDLEIEKIDNWFSKEEGLLSAGSNKNPYGSSASANMVHYIYADKPSRILKLSKGRYALNIATDKIIRINEFIKKYTGFDMTENPLSYGDIFIFQSHAYKYRTNEEDSIIIDKVHANSTVVVRFKNDGVIVSTKQINVDCETENLEIKTDAPWLCHDLEIYVNGILEYYKQDCSYLRHFYLTTRVRGSKKRVPLNKISDSYEIEYSSEHTSHIGRKEDKEKREYEELFRKSADEIRKKLVDIKSAANVSFIKPGEKEKAFTLITGTLERAENEIWLFDSYFTDKRDTQGMLDWLRIIANYDAASKNIVFYCKDLERALDVPALKEQITNDRVLNDILRTKRKLGIHFYQTRAPIHDRFILIESFGTFEGISIGTSLNSLNNNHYCIYEFNHTAAQTVCDELRTWLYEDGNLITDEEM